MTSKNTTQMTTAKFGNQSDSKVKEFDEDLEAEVEWQTSIDIEMEDGEVPDERERSCDLQTIYAQNGFYNKSINKTEMLTKHIYYENLKDFVDEQLCTVAAKISEKK